MDRSFLADDKVIAASRKFVCIRLATYENAQENEVLKKIFAPGGQLQNTVFTILAPDGKTELIRSGRSPVWAFGGSRGPGLHQQSQANIDNMSRGMEAIARRYPGTASGEKAEFTVPYIADVRLALNIAACDKLPLLVVFANDDKQLNSMEDNLEPLVWSKNLVGRFLYVAAKKPADLALVNGATSKPEFLIVQPNTFGTKGSLIKTVSAEASTLQLGEAMMAGLEMHKPSSLTYEAHRRAGDRANIRWETATPVTDAHGRGPGGPSPRRGGRRPPR